MSLRTFDVAAKTHEMIVKEAWAPLAAAIGRIAASAAGRLATGAGRAAIKNPMSVVNGALTAPSIVSDAKRYSRMGGKPPSLPKPPSSSATY